MNQTEFFLAVHEAGHAVSHFALNASLARLESWVQWMVLTGASSGSVHVMRSRMADPMRSAITCLSGYVAEQRFVEGEAWLQAEAERVPISIAAGDYDHLEDIAMARGHLSPAGLDTAEGLATAWRRTHALIVAEWEPLLRVATLLHHKGRLTGAEAEREWREAR